MAGTPTSRYNVGNLDQWGRLIKSWATHHDYINLQGNAEPPRDYTVNKSWGDQPPASVTRPDKDASGKPYAWCLPPGGPVPVARPVDGGSVNLPFAVAMTPDDFLKRVAAAGVAVTYMPPQYTNVVIVQGDVHTMVMRLPPADTLEGSEDDLLSGQVQYTLRAFYSQLYGSDPKYPTDRAGIMELHANRIGEYTLNNCM